MTASAAQKGSRAGWSAVLSQLRWRCIGRALSGSSPSNCVLDPGSISAELSSLGSLPLNEPNWKKHWLFCSVWLLCALITERWLNLCDSGRKFKIQILFKQGSLGPVNWRWSREAIASSTTLLCIQHGSGCYHVCTSISIRSSPLLGLFGNRWAALCFDLGAMCMVTQCTVPRASCHTWWGHCSWQRCFLGDFVLI